MAKQPNPTTRRTSAAGRSAATRRSPSTKFPASICSTSSVAPDGVFSTSFANLRIETVGCLFRDVPRNEVRNAGERQPPRSPQTPARPAQDLAPTRIRPPRDVVKLADRLRMLLEPPLESLLAAESLRFPLTPFPFQFDGVAFLYPRHRSGAGRRDGPGQDDAGDHGRPAARAPRRARSGVLLVCPKPLVTNWQREFAVWAPELPVTVDRRRAPNAGSGSGETRATWSRSPTTNRSSATPTQSAIRANHFDLVVLDESQRIKNRASTTNQVVRSIPRSRSWALTGTPVENSAEDLVGIFEFLAPGPRRRRA